MPADEAQSAVAHGGSVAHVEIATVPFALAPLAASASSPGDAAGARAGARASGLPSADEVACTRDLAIATAVWSALGEDEGGLELSPPEFPGFWVAVGQPGLVKNGDAPDWYQGWKGEAPSHALVERWFRREELRWRPCAASRDVLPIGLLPLGPATHKPFSH